jgi:ribosomal protein S18 acetylase RimI-like enzyme
MAERLVLKRATEADIASIARLRADVANALTAKFGPGHWSSPGTENGVRLDLRNRGLFIARRNRRLIATLRLGTKKPWAIDPAYFSASPRPLYLTNMAVHPDLQRCGIGRACLEEVVRIAREWPADAVRLDAYDADAGAGGFYARCGFREVGRVIYRSVGLIYYERLIPDADANSRRRL